MQNPYLNCGSSVIYSFETEIRKKSFPEDKTASISFRSIGVPCMNVYTITANGGTNNNPSIRIITVNEIETYNKIIILKKTATFIGLFIITGRPTNPIQQGLYKMYLLHNDYFKCYALANQTANYI